VVKAGIVLNYAAYYKGCNQLPEKHAKRREPFYLLSSQQENIPAPFPKQVGNGTRE
jgi:hypothetical protein